ncbi:DNA repair protein XRCC3 homolog [Prunus persica]|uniref:DNA repair protein XRCC3 homolog n=1 Tax=Prunus persica TaxID=3760 RepID=UPI0009AB73A3|nr:DNA repair protein XRCC3 homolog [Prunus persica]
MKAKIEIAPATAIMVFKESEAMAKLKKEEVESGFELFRNLYHASYPNLIRLEPLEDIYVHGAHDAQQLIHVLGDIEAFIAIDHTRLPMKLIVIDSIAALFRSQYQTTPADLKRRSEMFFNISGTLKGLANNFGLAVVVTNQVVDFIGPHDGVNGVRLGNLESLEHQADG